MRGGETENGRTVAKERSAGETLGDDVGDIVSGGDLHEADGLATRPWLPKGVQ